MHMCIHIYIYIYIHIVGTEEGDQIRMAEPAKEVQLVDARLEASVHI